MPKLNATRRTLLLMLAVFSVPYMLAWFFYFNPDLVDFGTRNNGTLISPVIGPTEFQLLQPDGQAFPANEGSDKWMLMMFGALNCQEPCKKSLFTLQQIRKMMGVDKARIKRAYVLLDKGNPQQLQAALAQYAGTQLLIADEAFTQLLVQRLGIKADQLNQYFMIADPEGNLVMWYPRDIDPKKVFADIEIFFGRVKGV